MANPTYTSQAGQVLPDTPSTGEQNADTQAGVLQGSKPSVSGDINSIMSSYLNQMANLGPEYQSEMNYLAPYVNPGAETWEGLLNTAALQQGPTGNTAVQAAGEGLGNAIEGMPKPGFGQEEQALNQYAQDIPFQAALSSGTAYQKYLQTYGGLQPPEAGWTEQQKQAYQAITGGSSTPGATSGGLPSIADVQASTKATQNITNPGGTTGNTGGGNVG